ncbi:hypothetical protein P4654_01980 [Niallia taxi]|uniref:hypothetical protein n=1 Tax=Niallia taxi TaxID=2499688 RepID=UPI002E1E57D7|nr:hypothetical protein [Niallia taxi]MED4118068.1 hypothetical protein [Niallia taxi]
MERLIELLPKNELGSIILMDNEQYTVEPDILRELIKDAVPLTYESLSALPVAGLGWQPIFNDWRVKGYIE